MRISDSHHARRRAPNGLMLPATPTSPKGRRLASEVEIGNEPIADVFRLANHGRENSSSISDAPRAGEELRIRSSRTCTAPSHISRRTSSIRRRRGDRMSSRSTRNCACSSAQQLRIQAAGPATPPSRNRSAGSGSAASPRRGTATWPATHANGKRADVVVDVT